MKDFFYQKESLRNMISDLRQIFSDQSVVNIELNKKHQAVLLLPLSADNDCIESFLTLTDRKKT